MKRAFVLLLLLFSVGVPFFVVSASAPLLQKWFSSTDHPAARDPYFLYGASNVGSMLALLAYPLVVERFVGLANQRLYWALGYGLLNYPAKQHRPGTLLRHLRIETAEIAIQRLSACEGVDRGPRRRPRQ